MSSGAVPQGYTLEKCPVCLGSRKVGDGQDCCHCNAWGVMPAYDTGLVTLFHGRALDVLGLLGDGSVSLIFTDPPYKGVKKDLAWDNQWKSDGEFLAWIGALCDEFKRVLAPNGSLYLCAFPRMVYAVEAQVRQRFNVLNSIRWYKDAGWHKKANVEALRSFLEPWESVIFAEQWGADGNAMNQSGYLTESDRLRGSVFEPIRAYLAGEFQRAGVKFERANEFCGVASMAGRHYFSHSQWCMPTREHYESLQRGLNAMATNGNEYLRREYEDLRREYEYLRREYEDLRRPFALGKGRPSTDLWTYEPVAPDDIKHECEKPLQMLLDIVETSSRPRDLVIDPFLGRGATAVACQMLGRRFIGGDMLAHWCDASKARLLEAKGEMHLRPKRPVEPPKAPKGQRALWENLE